MYQWHPDQWDNNPPPEVPLVPLLRAGQAMKLGAGGCVTTCSADDPRLLGFVTKDVWPGDSIAGILKNGLVRNQ